MFADKTKIFRTFETNVGDMNKETVVTIIVSITVLRQMDRFPTIYDVVGSWVRYTLNNGA
jgi:hypothetical protein